MKLLSGKLSRKHPTSSAWVYRGYPDRSQKLEQSTLGSLFRRLANFLHKNAEPKRENECRRCGGSMATFYSLGVHECFRCKRQYGIKDGIQIKHQR